MRLYSLALLLFIAQILWAQVPQSFNYQAIARNADHLPLGNAAISVEVNILRNGATVYTETDDLTTAPTGLFSIAVGNSNPADFQAIDWRLGGYELQVRLNGALDLVTPATPIIAVPFALMADEVLNEKQQLTLNGNQLSISGGNTVTLNTTGGGATTLNDLSDVSTTGATSGQVLQWNGSAWVPATVSAGGTLTAGPGIQISGNQVSNTGDINVNDDVTVTTQSGGDVSGVFADLQIKNGAVGATELADGSVTAPKLGPMGAGSGQVLKWNGSAWVPADVTVLANSITSTQIIDNSITINDLAPGVIPTTLPPSGVAGGDLSGTYPNPTVVKIQGKTVASTAPTDGQVLKWDAATSQWKPAADLSGGAGTTVAAGTGVSVVQNGNVFTVANTAQDVAVAIMGAGATSIAGSYPNFTITTPIAPSYAAGSGINITAQNQIQNTGDTNATDDLTNATNFAGDVTGVFNNLQIGANTIGSNEIANGSIASADLAAGVIPSTLPPSGVASGDLSGMYPNPTVAKLQGRTLASNAPSSGQILKWNGAAWAPANDDNSLSPWQSNGTSIFENGKLVSINRTDGTPLISMGNSNDIQNAGAGLNTSILFTYGANGSVKTALGNVNNNPNYGAIRAYTQSGVFGGSVAQLMASPSTDAGELFLMGTDQLPRTYIGSYNSDPTGSAMELYKNGTRMVDFGANLNGYAAFSGPNGLNNVFIGSLTDYLNHGYISVADENGIGRTGLFVNEFNEGYIYGDVAVASIKNFRMQDPRNSEQEIWYACVEGPEAAAYERGTANLVNGEAFVPYSDHFSLVISGDKITVQLTPLSADTDGLAVVEKTSIGFRVRELRGGKGTFSFDWEVKGVRKGYERYEVIRPKFDPKPSIQSPTTLPPQIRN